MSDASDYLVGFSGGTVVCYLFQVFILHRQVWIREEFENSLDIYNNFQFSKDYVFLSQVSFFTLQNLSSYALHMHNKCPMIILIT